MISSVVLSDFFRGMLSDILSGILSRILSDIVSGILSDIYSDILSGILLHKLFLTLFLHSIWHLLRHSVGILSGIRAQACPTASRAADTDMVFGAHSTVQKEDGSDGSKWRKEAGRKDGRKELDPYKNLGTFTWQVHPQALGGLNIVRVTARHTNSIFGFGCNNSSMLMSLHWSNLKTKGTTHLYILTALQGTLDFVGASSHVGSNTPIFIGQITKFWPFLLVNMVDLSDVLGLNGRCPLKNKQSTAYWPIHAIVHLSAPNVCSNCQTGCVSR